MKGWYSGIARDSEDTLHLQPAQRVASMNEVYPFEKAQEAYRADDERQGALPRRAQDGRLTSTFLPAPVETRDAHPSLS